MTGVAAEHLVWSDALLAAAILAVDSSGIGGVLLRSPPGPLREHWLSRVRDLLPAAAPFRRLPLNVADGRLLGGLDLAATLKAGLPVGERGILAEADGGVVIVAMAERLAQTTAARLTAVLDTREVILERDGIAARCPSRVAMVALDEGIDDERPPEALRDRLAIHIDLGRLRSTRGASCSLSADVIAKARARICAVEASEEVVAALCEASVALGIASLRAPLLALRVARANAALSCRDEITREDLEIAVRFVFAPRATQLPAQERSDATDAGADAVVSGENDHSDSVDPRGEQSLGDIIVGAANAAMPPDILASLRVGGSVRARAPLVGRAGIVRQSSRRGRPIGSRRGDLRASARLCVVDTLLAAVPWQALRRRDRTGADTTASLGPPRIEVRREDFHIVRFKQRTQTTTIFVVDASGSAALNRLAEAKGAVEYLLADCYVRRDQVALISFRGAGADVVLPPTRSLVRAKRSLAGLPGGGGTPLASGIDAARVLAGTLRQRGQTAVVVLLTDGRANIGRDGAAGRAKAEDDALAAARLMRLNAISTLLIDTSPRPQPFAQRIAAEMGATYLALPFADAAAVSRVVRASSDARRPGAARDDLAGAPIMP